MADTKPVFDKILESCKHLFGSDETAVLLVDEEDQVSLGAYVGNVYEAVAATFPAPLELTPAGHAIRERRVVHYPDMAHDAGHAARCAAWPSWQGTNRWPTHR